VNATGGNLIINGNVASTGGGGTGTLLSRGTSTATYNGTINLGVDRIFNKTDTGTAIIRSTGNSWLRTQASDGQIQLGAHNALPNVEFTLGQGSGTNGRLELNGFNQTVTNLNTWPTSAGTLHVLRNSNTAAASTLTFATPVTRTDIARNLNIYGTASGLGTLHLVSSGEGRTELQDGLLEADTWTANSGTLAFTGPGQTVSIPGDLHTGNLAGTSGNLILQNSNLTVGGITLLAEVANSTTNVTLGGTSVYTANNRIQMALNGTAVCNFTIQDSARLVHSGGWFSVGNDGTATMTVKDNGSLSTTNADFNISDVGTSTGTLDRPRREAVTL